MFIAPTEPARLKEIGVSSSLPERYGVDIYWESVLGKIGVQRKVFPGDFLASVFGRDGRLYREFKMMQGLDYKVLLIEGRELWTSDGALVRDRTEGRWKWDRTQHRNYLHSVSYLYGVTVHHTDNLTDTIEYLHGLQLWADKADHSSLERRPGPAIRNGWGEVDDEAWAVHLLQGIDGVGPKVAKAILGYFGGVPFRLTCDVKDLESVPGIGPKMAMKIWRTFNRVSDA